MAQRRLELLASVQLLSAEGTVAAHLAEVLCMKVPMPPQAYTDAMHIALGAVRGMAYLLTWNCKHIANPRLYPRIEKICADWGFTTPVLCTPTELR